MSKSSKRGKITRRAFIISGSIVGGGLALGLGGIAYSNHKKRLFSGLGFEDAQALNPFIFITSNNKVKLAVARAEMGQGVHHSMAMLAGEELDINPELIEVIHPQVEGPYANINLATEYKRNSSSDGFHLMQKIAYVLPYIATGGSTSVRDGYDHYRIIGAQVREMLKAAAAKKWNTDKDNLLAENGFIIHPDGEKLTYGELAQAASEIEPIDKPVLKSKDEFKWLGKDSKRIDLRSKVNGQAQFGIDVRVPGMKFGAIKHVPIKGARLERIVNASEISNMPGVSKVIQLDNGGVVVADNTWRAKNAANQLKLELEDTEFEKTSSNDLHTEMTGKLEDDMQVVAEKKGKVDTVFKANNKHVEATYEVPYLAHATMEPMNCTMLVEEGKVKVWVGQQAPFLVLNAVSKITGVSKKNIEIYITYLGGGFGRRAEMDWIQETAQVAKEMKGIPVQLVWTREEDMQNDTYRPPAIAKMRALLDEDNNEVTAWEHHNVMQSALRSSIRRNFPIMTPPPSKDVNSSEGAINLPYDFKSSKIGFSLIENPIPVGFWRSVGHSINGFFTESFIDELAHSANADPYEFRRTLLVKSPRHLHVLNKAAELSNWRTPVHEHSAKGIALHESFGSIVAQVIEIGVDGNMVLLDKVTCVIDCGKTVNPNNIEAQMQSGIVYGLTAACLGEITFTNGKIDQANFPTYDILRLKHMPEIVTHIVESDETPGGVGEPGTPPIAAALCNALYAATGQRIRKLPLRLSGFSFS